MNDNQLLDILVAKVDRLSADMGALLQAQQISNWLAVSTNPSVPEETRNMALNQALNVMGLHQRSAAEDSFIR